MKVAWALLAVSLACWKAWRGLAARLDDTPTALPLLLVAAALALQLLKGAKPPGRVPLPPLTALLVSYALAAWLAPPVFSIALATLALCYCLHAAAQAQAPRAAFPGLVLLALPVLPTLEFYSAYPVRLAAIEATASLLRMNGVAVDVEGLALAHGGQLIQFDAPCSGVGTWQRNPHALADLRNDAAARRSPAFVELALRVCAHQRAKRGIARREGRVELGRAHAEAVTLRVEGDLAGTEECRQLRDVAGLRVGEEDARRYQPRTQRIP